MEIATVSNQIPKEVVDSLDTINKFAKKLQRHPLTSDCWRDSCSSSRVTITRQRVAALYATKHRILNECLSYSSRVEYHRINEEEYYCIYFGSRSFHIPVGEVDREVDVCDHKHLVDFESSIEPHTGLALEDALYYVKENLGIDANSYLEYEVFVDELNREVDLTWDYN